MTHNTYIYTHTHTHTGFPSVSVVKNKTTQNNKKAHLQFRRHAEDMNSIPGSGRSPREEKGNPLQYSCLGNHMDRGAWWATVHGVTKQLDMTWRLNSNNM